MRPNSLLTIALVLSLVPAGALASVTPPPDAPSWWDNPPLDALWWGFTNSLGEVNTNFAEFGVTVNVDPGALKPTAPGQGTRGSYFQFIVNNGYVRENTKWFFIHVAGTGAGYLPAGSGAPVAGNNPPPVRPSTISPLDGGFAPTLQPNGAWSVTVAGTARPQPQTLWLTFNVWGTSTDENTVQMTSWYVGEFCIPEPASAMLLVAGASLLRRR